MQKDKNQLFFPTVWFFTFEIFYDDITQRVIEIIQFCKKFLKANDDAFYDL